jgi:transposase
MKHNAQTTGIGIDVSRSKLDIAMLDNEGEVIHFIVPNNESGIEKIGIRIKGYRGKIVMESTGRYHLLSALRLYEAGFDVRVINPLVSRKYMQAGIRKNKTDKADACKLAEIAVIEKRLPESFSADTGTIQIRQKIGLIASLETQIQTLKAIMNNYHDFQEQLKIDVSEAEKAVAKAVNQLTAAKIKLEKEIETLILKASKRNEKREILTSVPGISDYAASLILQFFGEGYNKSAKQWIAYAGMDVSVKQSGTWHGKGSLSKRGNAYLRKRLYCAAWGASMNNGSFRRYYDELKEGGRKHAEALIIIARKLIRIAFTLLKNNQLFNEKLCFSY